MSRIIFRNGQKVSRWENFWYYWGGAMRFLFCACLAVFLISSCVKSEWFQEHERKQEAQRQADRQPRVIREVDGCKVYAFKTGDWHYFTRCGSTVTTDRHYQVREGKVTKNKVETIVTEGNN